MTDYECSLEGVKKRIEADDDGDGMYDCPLNWAQIVWLADEVERYETLIKVIHELAHEHLYEPSPDGKEIPAIHALTKETE